MKKLLLVLGLAMLISSPLGKAEAIPFFTYDDFTLTYGTVGNPGSAGSAFVTFGKVEQLGDVNHTIVGWYYLTGTTTAGAQSVGTQWITDYDVSTLTLYLDQLKTTPLWSGTGDVKTIVNKDGSVFPNIYPTNYHNQPANFNSVGNGLYTGGGIGGGGVFDNYSTYQIGWLGTYNWAYDNSDPTKVTKQFGNAQSDLHAVPEPATMLLLGSGLLGIGIIVRRKFKK
jgi:hypothetical protein